MKLYYAPRTRAGRPRWLLEELGVPYDLVTVDLSGEGNRTPTHLAVHPLGQVPALADGDVTLHESLAICLYLADKFPDKGFAPAVDSPDRGPYYQWTAYCIGTLEPRLIALGGARGRHVDEPDHEEVGLAREAFAASLAVVEQALDGRDYLVGDRFTVADLMIGSLIGWMMLTKMYEVSPALARYARGLTSRPAFQRAMAD